MAVRIYGLTLAASFTKKGFATLKDSATKLVKMINHPRHTNS